jgi:hypothetical protein
MSAVRHAGVAVMVGAKGRRRAIRVPNGVDPAAFAAAYGAVLSEPVKPPRLSDGLAFSVRSRPPAATLPVASSLDAQLAAGLLIPARQAASRLGGPVFASAVRTKTLTVHVVRGKRYVASAAVDALVSPRYRRGASEAIAQAVRESIVDETKSLPRTRPKRDRKIPSWAARKG